MHTFKLSRPALFAALAVLMFGGLVLPNVVHAASTAPLLPGEALWNGVPSYLFGMGDTYDYIGATGFDHNTAIQSQVKAAGVPLIRAFFEEVDETDHTTPNTDAHQLAIAQAIAASGAQCMANLTQPMDVTYALHLVTLLQPYCRYFEVYNEPDLSGSWPPAISTSGYLTFWNSFVPQARALDPNAAFGGPATADEFGEDSTGTYMQTVLAGMAASGVWPDFVSYHWYMCTNDSATTCLNTDVGFAAGHGKTVAGWLAQDFPGKPVALGITEWNADPGNPAMEYDDTFMHQYEAAALAGLEQNPYLSFATQFDIASYAGFGALDQFVTTSGEGYTNTPDVVGTARPMFGVLAQQIQQQSSGVASTATPVPSATPTGTTTPTVQGVPRYAHVINILEENHSYSDVIGSSAAPYINNTLLANGALATNMQSEVASSLPNYMALTGGTTLGWTANCEPDPTPPNGVGSCPGGLSTGASMFTRAPSAKSYEENMGAACVNAVDGGVGGLYTVHHNPEAYYTQAPCATNDVDYSQLATALQSPGALPAYVFITPNLNDDMHNGTVQQGDTWLQQNLPAIQQSPACTQSTCLIAITWDEGSTDEHIATLLLGQGVLSGARDGTAYNHYNLLKTEELALGVGTLTANDAGAAPMLGMFGAASPTPTPTPNPTATPTSTPSPTATPNPTATPSPAPSGTLLSDNFEQDAVGAPPAGWKVESGNWDVQVDGTHVLRQQTSPEASSYISVGSNAWTDYTLTASVKPASGHLNATYNLMGRYTDANNHYSLILKNGNEWWLGVKKNGNWSTIASGNLSFTSQFYTFSLTFAGSKVTGAINGVTLGSGNDASFTAGRIAYQTDSNGELDNVLVTGTGTPVPTPTPSPTPSPTATPSPTPVPPTPTPTPSPVPVNNVPCTVVINGVSEQGTCSGTFTPAP